MEVSSMIGHLWLATQTTTCRWHHHSIVGQIYNGYKWRTWPKAHTSMNDISCTLVFHVLELMVSEVINGSSSTVSNSTPGSSVAFVARRLVNFFEPSPMAATYYSLKGRKHGGGALLLPLCGYFKELRRYYSKIYSM